MQERLCRPQAFKGRRGEAALWAVGPKKKGMTLGHALLFGGGEEIRTLAPAKPTYRISNPDPSTTWVHLHRTQTGPGLSPRRKKPQADGGASVSDTRQTIRAEDSLIKDTKKAERNQEGRGKK